MYSQIEENYLKTIFKLSLIDSERISTSAIAQELGLQSASVTDMIKRLSGKDLIHYVPYQGVSLSQSGRKVAVNIVRKHRLWEVFLAEKLHFKWSEIHDLAEQLEHIQSDELINRLDDFLGNPAFDPHGGPIPDKSGNIPIADRKLLSDLPEGTTGKILGVREDSRELLEFLEGMNVHVGMEFTLQKRFEFDSSLLLVTAGQSITLSRKVGHNLWVISQEKPNSPEK